MKKNWTMRVGALLMVLTLITSCFVGGTFAKYVTDGESTDTARVAKFGVEVTGEGTMFAKEYDSDTDGYTGVTVQSTENVVAPGTSGSLTKFDITGTPEVAVKVTYSVDELTLVGWTAEDDSYYCPLVVTVGSTNIDGLNYDSIDAFTTDVKKAIEATSAEYAPGTDLETENATDALSVSWKWNYDNNADGANAKQDDAKDTYLGDQAADGNASKITLKVTATVTQID